MIAYKDLQLEEIQAFWDFLNELDKETDFMMYEEDERKNRTNCQELREDIENHVIGGGDFLQIAEEDGKIVGYIRAERGRFQRIFHTAYIVVGVLKKYQNRGIGTTFFKHISRWAEKNGVVRLELTVECDNEAAIHLYKRNGFQIEGIRKKAMRVHGKLVNEYYMAKIFERYDSEGGSR